MEAEITQYNKGTRAEFLNDALKFYLEYLENKRLELWKMEKEQSDSVSSPSAEAVKTGLGGGVLNDLGPWILEHLWNKWVPL